MNARGNGGYMLIELQIAAVLMLAVLSATLGAFDVFVRTTARSGALIQNVDVARGAMSRMTRDVRDAAAAGTGGVLLRAAPADLVMNRVDPSTGAVHTVRWCLDVATARLYRQTHAGVRQSQAACPEVGTGWTQVLVAGDIVNGERPVFAYDTGALRDITKVDAMLAVDTRPGQARREVKLQSGVFLRNQNRRPIASFSHVALPGRNVQLNAQPSRDPEGAMLTYVWRDGEETLPYGGAVAAYVSPSAGPRTITLTVSDSDGLEASVTQVVQVLP